MKRRKMKKYALLAAIVVVIVPLLMWGRITGEVQTFEDTEIACLPGGHQGAAQHIHAGLSIFEDGEQVQLPANAGINAACMAEVHTHDSSGTIHVETVDANTDYTLNDVFTILDRDLQRDGYELSMTMNGTTTDVNGDMVIEDQQRIVLQYQSEGAATATSTNSQDVSPVIDENTNAADGGVELDVDAGTQQQ